MGTMKHFEYAPQVTAISLTGRALAHPCRVRILELISENKQFISQDLANYFGMTRSSIHQHLVKLWQGGLIQITSEQSGTTISMSHSQIEKFNLLTCLFTFETKDAFHLGVLN